MEQYIKSSKLLCLHKDLMKSSPSFIPLFILVCNKENEMNVNIRYQTILVVLVCFSSHHEHVRWFAFIPVQKKKKNQKKKKGKINS